ncbi:hypothetical protein KSS87_013862 [Heliosperma pusillum]|nr:hypothetical protein KSS87_013861 [Heliosperma pusillum]KAH9617441.1 hypothetical protein KSS87_013862 [Heliosperma pusillum]
MCEEFNEIRGFSLIDVLVNRSVSNLAYVADTPTPEVLVDAKSQKKSEKKKKKNATKPDSNTIDNTGELEFRIE